MVVDSPPATLLDVMSSKWILLSALLAGFGLNIATAQSDSRNCVITRTDGSTTHDVPQFCLSSTLGGNLLGIFPQMKLNFTSIVLRPLPENRQVEIEELDGSPGLAGLANTIANAVSRGRLPYGIVNCYIALRLECIYHMCAPHVQSRDQHFIMSSILKYVKL